KQDGAVLVRVAMNDEDRTPDERKIGFQIPGGESRGEQNLGPRPDHADFAWRPIRIVVSSLAGSSPWCSATRTQAAQADRASGPAVGFGVQRRRTFFHLADTPNG